MPIEPAAAAAPQCEWVHPPDLTRAVTQLLCHAGLDELSAGQAADVLVQADLCGIASHGVTLVPLYLERLRAGSVSVAPAAEVVLDAGATLVLDAHDALGQLTSLQAVRLLRARAPLHGVAAVAVRNAFHFGAAGYWASQLAEQGLVGLALSNTRPLMPAPGGAQPVVGNNPLALAVPSADASPIVVDMAMSAAAMGKIRLAAAAGQALPAGWAADVQGVPTTDAQRAVAGMLLPAGGAKGFGLAFLIDLVCGALSGGAIGPEVQRLYGDPDTPYGCSHFFLAVDIAHFVPVAQFRERAHAFAQWVRNARRAPGTGQLYVPGEQSWLRARQHQACCPIAPATLAQLRACARAAGLDASGFLPSTKTQETS